MVVVIIIIIIISIIIVQFWSFSWCQIRVESSYYDRNLVSAELVLAGLYPPVPAQQWNENLDWQPIPVHTRPIEDDQVSLKYHVM